MRAATTAPPRSACGRCSGNQPNLETFLFDFAGDLYGEHLSVALVEFLRPEATFDSVATLVAQMDDDCARAREILDAL
jgi:riboflavin kinase / FMN adenylyltransferase